MTSRGEVVCAFKECGRRIGSAEWWLTASQEELAGRFLMIDKEPYVTPDTERLRD
jgi:hypothetical protein